MGKKHFILDSRGHCLFCLKPKNRRKTGSVNISNGASFQRIVRSLNINTKKIFNNAMNTASPVAISVLEESELIGTLCDKCERLLVKTSKICEELEKLEMMLDYNLACVKEELEKPLTDLKSLKMFHAEMTRSSQAKVNFGIVEGMRREIWKKCFLRKKRSQTHVVLDNLIENTNPRLNPSQEEFCPVIVSVSGGATSNQVEFSEDSEPILDITATAITQSMLMNIEASPPVRVVHKGRKYECNFCHRVFRNNHILKKHKIVAHSGPSLPSFVSAGFQCNTCLKTCGSRKELDDHKRQDHKSRAIQKTYGNKKLRRNSPVKVVVQPQPKEDIPLITLDNTCNICQKEFGRPALLSLHMKMVHSKNDFQCPRCPNSYPYRIALNNHIKQAHEDPFPTPPESEVAIPNGDSTPAPFKCRWCTKPFNHSSSLSRHRFSCKARSKNATMNKPHQCAICNQSFSKPIYLNDHVLTKHEGKLFKCPFCPHLLKQRSNLWRHKMKCHPEELTGGRRKKRGRRRGIKIVKFTGKGFKTPTFQCTLCDKSFVLRSSMRRHMKAIHKRSMKTMTNPKYHSKIRIINSERIELVDSEKNETDFISEFNDDEFEDVQEEPSHEMPKLQKMSQEPPSDLGREKAMPVLEVDGELNEETDSGDEDTDAQFECHLCDKQYSIRESLNVHIRTVHERIRFSCTWCKKQFTQAGAKNVHMKLACPKRMNR